VKPLPAPPRDATVRFGRAQGGTAKPLPEIPRRPDYTTTLFWIGGMGIWFLAVVLLLPVFLEGDALPRLNGGIRKGMGKMPGCAR
jgi:hypothetical protein